MKLTLIAFAALIALGLAADAAEPKDELFEMLMSDMPLKVGEKKDALEGEHQANDMGQIIILVVEKDCGTAI